MRSYTRSQEDVTKIIHHAKLDDRSLLPVTQAIYFGDDSNEELKLMELDEHLLAALENRTRLTFRGGKDDKVVLCSHDRTYDVREAETSNSLLLIKNLKFANEIESISVEDTIDETAVQHKNVIGGVFHTYYEAKPCKPKFNKLRALLEEGAYRGSELEAELTESGVNFYSTENLLNTIQASEVEMKQALDEMFAFELNGKWRVLEFAYHTRVLGYFLNTIDHNSWKHDDIPVDELVSILTELMPQFIAEYLLFVYCKRTGENDNIAKLLENRVCRILGEELLKPTGRFELSEFLKAWRECVPEGLSVNLRQLDGTVYVSGALNREIIHYCPEYELPEEMAERFQTLFKFKEKWTFDEIKPYIKTFTTEKMNENAILTKYARASNCNGTRFYSNRHGK